jgi:hypothetical protein
MCKVVLPRPLLLSAEDLRWDAIASAFRRLVQDHPFIVVIPALSPYIVLVLNTWACTPQN